MIYTDIPGDAERSQTKPRRGGDCNARRGEKRIRGGQTAPLRRRGGVYRINRYAVDRHELQTQFDNGV